MSNSSSSTVAESPEKLIEHISRLMDEAEAMLAGPVAEPTSSKLSEIHSRLDRAQAQLANFYEQTRRKIADGARYTDQTIRSHPYESLAVALGVGVVVGLLVRRSNS